MKFDVATLIAASSLLLLVAAATAVQAESLPDPTRPPDALQSAATGAGEPPPAGLQSIIRSDRGRPAAIINGEYVVLGGLVGDAKLVKIGEDSVTLKSAAGTETLKLMPGIEKTPASGIEKQGARAKAPGKKGRK